MVDWIQNMYSINDNTLGDWLGDSMRVHLGNCLWVREYEIVTGPRRVIVYISWHLLFSFKIGFCFWKTLRTTSSNTWNWSETFLVGKGIEHSVCSGSRLPFSHWLVWALMTLCTLKHESFLPSFRRLLSSLDIVQFWPADRADPYHHGDPLLYQQVWLKHHCSDDELPVPILLEHFQTEKTTELAARTWKITLELLTDDGETTEKQIKKTSVCKVKNRLPC